MNYGGNLLSLIPGNRADLKIMQDQQRRCVAEFGMSVSRAALPEQGHVRGCSHIMLS